MPSSPTGQRCASMQKAGRRMEYDSSTVRACGLWKCPLPIIEAMGPNANTRLIVVPAVEEVDRRKQNARWGGPLLIESTQPTQLHCRVKSGQGAPDLMWQKGRRSIHRQAPPPSAARPRASGRYHRHGGKQDKSAPSMARRWGHILRSPYSSNTRTPAACLHLGRADPPSLRRGGHPSTPHAHP